MRYSIRVVPSAERSLARIARDDRTRVVAAIDRLALGPRSGRASKLAGVRDTWRIRVGDYRVLYLIDDPARVVTVTRIAHRSDAYR